MSVRGMFNQGDGQINFVIIIILSTVFVLVVGFFSFCFLVIIFHFVTFLARAKFYRILRRYAFKCMSLHVRLINLSFFL
jgi:hypothetical protein